MCQQKLIYFHYGREKKHVETIHQDELAIDTKSRAFRRLNRHGAVHVGH